MTICDRYQYVSFTKCGYDFKSVWLFVCPETLQTITVVVGSIECNGTIDGGP